MIQDPAILANILGVVIFALAMVPVYLFGRRHGRELKRLWKLRRREPESFGDEGGHPQPLSDLPPCRSDTPAPEIWRGGEIYPRRAGE